MAARATDKPRVRVAALMVLDGRIVLVRHRAGASRYHLLPGGGVDWGETLEQALTREIAEETGLEATVGRLLFVNDTIDPSGGRHVVNITFEAAVTGGEITATPADPRVEAVDLFGTDELAQLDLRPPMAAAIAAWLTGVTPTSPYLGSLFTPGA
ncbi:MAG: NUDIX hydrolase [Coriobacteriia bacterium]|nr:NUDIX hydrolase [Coriobacteriia bacterium]